MKIKRMNKVMRFILPKTIGITLAPFGIYLREDEDKDELLPWRLLNHELIHWRQQMEMLIIFFYVWYLVEWFVRLLIPPVGAYIEISFEREANDGEDYWDYLDTRKRFAWVKFIHIKSKDHGKDKTI